MTRNGSTFDQLNDALFAQLDKLQSVDPKNAEIMEQTIEQSRAVSNLARNVIDNMNSAVNTLRFYEQAGMDAGGLVASSPKMLGGGQ